MQSAIFQFILCATRYVLEMVKQTLVVSTSVFKAQHHRADIWNKPLTFASLSVSAEIIACSCCKMQQAWLVLGSKTVGPGNG